MHIINFKKEDVFVLEKLAMWNIIYPQLKWNHIKVTWDHLFTLSHTSHSIYITFQTHSYKACNWSSLYFAMHSLYCVIKQIHVLKKTRIRAKRKFKTFYFICVLLENERTMNFYYDLK
jgi:hypothetical protein